MPNGTIKFFNAAKKFGFVTPDDGGKDVFVPVASVAAAGISLLKAGQRVSFETAPDGKGPKAVNLALIEGPPPLPPVARFPKPASREEGRAQFTFYHDAACDRSRAVLDAFRAAGLEMREIDYVATPPGREDLIRLSRLLHDGDGSLVRRYDPLFHDLRLDDRFISQNEFWDGIVENPTLINGPVIATANSVRICHTHSAAKQFLATVFPERAHVAVERHAVAESAAPRAAKVVAARPEAADEEAGLPETVSAKSDAPKTAAAAGKKTKAAPKAKAKVKAEPAAKKTAKKPRTAKKK
jgi:cold shock CspA family protein/arsenate reductase-like glutaredoxin family protein